MLRIFRTAKAEGCKFYTASDAHKPEHYTHYRAMIERAIDLLNLKKSNKFHI